MNEIKMRGIVLRENITGESDKFIVLLVKGVGKVSVFCKGARNTKSKYLSGTSLFSYGDFIVTALRNNYRLKSVDTIESFYSLRNDLSTLSYATYFAEFADKVTMENNPNDALMLLLLKSLKQLTAQKISNSLISGIFALKAMQLCGYEPYLQGCCECGSEETSFMGTEGLLCKNCAKHLTAIPISNDVKYVIAYIIASDINQVFSFGVGKETEEVLEKVNTMFIQYHLGVYLKSYKFIKDNKL